MIKQYSVCVSGGDSDILNAMIKYAVVLTFLLVALACSGGAETVVPVTTTAPVATTTAAPTTTESTQTPTELPTEVPTVVPTETDDSTTSSPMEIDECSDIPDLTQRSMCEKAEKMGMSMEDMMEMAEEMGMFDDMDTGMDDVMTMDPTPLPELVNSEVVDGYDYRLDDANVLNHLRPDNEACIFHSLGDATLKALRTRPMDQAENNQVMHCFGRGAEDGQMVDSPQPEGDVWEGPTICTSHGVFYQPPAFGVAMGQPIADPTAIVLDDGRIRLYAFAQEIGIVSAVSDDGLVFVEESGVRIAGTEAGQPRVWRLPDGRWRMYVSKVKEIVSFTSDDGLDFIKDPGYRLTAQAAGMPAISSPSIVEVEPGLWRMYYSTLAVPGTGPGGKRSGSATSTDLLEWTVDPGWRLGEGAQYLTDSAEHPFPVIAADGSVSLFYGKFRASQDGAPDGLWRATSGDGLTFTDEAYTGLYFGNDPEVLLLPSGERIIYYGNFDPAIGGQLLSAACTEW